MVRKLRSREIYIENHLDSPRIQSDNSQLATLAKAKLKKVISNRISKFDQLRSHRQSSTFLFITEYFRRV